MIGGTSTRSRIAILFTGALIALFAAVVSPRFQTALAANVARDQDDFHTFYRTARCLFVEPCDPYMYVAGLPPNLEPPHAHFLLLPVARLPKFTAYAVWMGLSFVALVVAAIRFLNATDPPLGKWFVVALILALAGSSLMMATVSSGQIYAVLTLPVTEVWLAWRRNKMIRAAAWLGLAAAVKPTLLLPILWLLIHGQRRSAAIGAALFASVGGLGLVCFGVSAHVGWLNTMTHLPLEGHFRDGSILAALVRGLTPSQYMPQVADAPTWVFPLWTVLSGLLLSITLLRPLSPDRTWLSLLACACLVAPKGWIYAGWWLVFPAITVWRSTASPWVRGILVVAAGLAWLPDTAPMWGQPSSWLTLTWGSLYLWLWLMIWLATQLPSSPRVAYEF